MFREVVGVRFVAGGPSDAIYVTKVGEGQDWPSPVLRISARSGRQKSNWSMLSALKMNGMPSSTVPLAPTV